MLFRVFLGFLATRPMRPYAAVLRPVHHCAMQGFLLRVQRARREAPPCFKAMPLSCTHIRRVVQFPCMLSGPNPL